MCDRSHLNRHERRKAKRRHGDQPECSFSIEEAAGDSVDLFVVFDGMKIARRGYPDSPQAKTWVSLEPGWAVTDTSPNEIAITFNGTAVH